MGGGWSCGREEAWAVAASLRAGPRRSLLFGVSFLEDHASPSLAVGLRGGMGAGTKEGLTGNCGAEAGKWLVGVIS